MVEAVMLWNEPNNLSHWDFKVDPDWKTFSRMVIEAARAIREVNPGLPIVLGGISPIDAPFMRLMGAQGVLDAVDIVALHGFPLDWNHWNVNEWPNKIDEIRAVTDRPIWISEVGASSFGAEEVQAFGVERMIDLLYGRVDRIHWYSLLDLPATWSATTRHKEAEGSSYYRHYYMGLFKEDGAPKLSAAVFPRNKVGVCQWFHFEDPRFEFALRLLKQLAVPYLRTGISWADSFRPNAEAWFDKQMAAIDHIPTTVTFCFTPEHLGVWPNHTSPPREPELFAEFAQRMVKRYAPSKAATKERELKIPVGA